MTSPKKTSSEEPGLLIVAHRKGVGNAAFHFPPLDVIDGDERYRILVDLAGCRPEHVSVDIDRFVVTIYGDRPAPDCGDGRYVVLERPVGPFERRVELAEPVDPARSAASLADGILVLDLAKLRRSSRTIPISKG